MTCPNTAAAPHCQEACWICPPLRPSERESAMTETCQRRPHYGEPCDCEARLALVVTHTRTSTGGFGPDYCAECSEAISEWVPWPCRTEQPLRPSEPTAEESAE